MTHNKTTSTCWGKALLCPTEDKDDSGLTCEAWYRCEGVSDYVIRWRCRISTENPNEVDNVHNQFRACNDNATTQYVNAEECPPPVVCPTSVHGGDAVRVSNWMSFFDSFQLYLSSLLFFCFFFVLFVCRLFVVILKIFFNINLFVLISIANQCLFVSLFV